MGEVSSDKTVIWRPQEGPQEALIACPIEEVFYGGARGGGKTEGSVGDWLEHSNTYGEAATGVFFRRTHKQLEEVIARTKQLFPKIGAKYREQQSEWTMPQGARLKFRYLERDSDAEEYQGHSYTRVYVEEVTNFPSPGPINKLRATLRSPTGVPCGIRLTGNPGGPGHNWVKARYIDPAPMGWQVFKESFTFEGVTRESERIFIPSKLTDNPLLMKNDPGYITRLYQSGSEQLVKAWLTGDWSMIDGAFFDCWDPRIHVLPAGLWLPKIPRYATKFFSMDWGYARPFSVGWWAVSDGNWGLPENALVRYREWYGWNGKPNTGLRMDPDKVADGILLRQAGEDIQYGVCDPSMFIRNGGPAIAETMIIRGLPLRRGDNRRDPGWTEVRRLMSPVGGAPLLYVLDNCRDGFMRTVPNLQHSETKFEDLDTDGEDHPADDTRYGVMSRPYITADPNAPEPEEALPKTVYDYTIMELIQRQAERRRAEETQ